VCRCRTSSCSSPPSSSSRWRCARCPAAARKVVPTTLLAALLTALAAACQPLPHPFQPDAKHAIAEGYLRPSPRSGLVVAAPDGLPGDAGAHLATFLAAGLRDREIPAVAGAAAENRYRVIGAAAPEHDPFAADGDPLTVRFQWTVVDPEGAVGATVEQAETTSRAALRTASPDVLAPLADRAAARIAAAIARDDPASARRTLSALPIARVDGSGGRNPGADGAVALANALRHALEMRHVPLRDTIDDDTYVVLGAVYVTPAAGHETVEIEWLVIRPDGTRLGAVRQRNDVPPGRTARAWGDLAAAAARGGADGIVDLLQRRGLSWRAAPADR
jgi:hypothetical protein